MTFEEENVNGYKPFSTADDSLFVPEIREGFLTLSAAQAGAIRRQFRYDRQTRDLKPAGEQHMNVLADLMRREGRWRKKEKIDFARLNDQFILMNGHHRLGAQALSGEKVEWLIVIHECYSDEQVAELYFSFDTNIRHRTAHTILGVIDLAGLLGIQKETATRLWSAIPLIANNFEFSPIEKITVVDKVIDRRLDIAKNYRREIVAWETAVNAASRVARKKLGSQGALAVALVAFRYQPHLAKSFWGGLALNDGLRKGDPRHTYNRYINGEFEPKNIPGATAWCAAIAWNAWFNERTLEYLKLSPVFYIEGTPIDRQGVSKGAKVGCGGGPSAVRA